jgi:hypothetical protein
MSNLCIEQERDYTSASDYRQKELEYTTKHMASKTIFTESDKHHSYFGLGEAYDGLTDIHVHLSQCGLAHKNWIAAKELYEQTDHSERLSKISDIERKIKGNDRFLSEDGLEMSSYSQ